MLRLMTDQNLYLRQEGRKLELYYLTKSALFKGILI